MKYKAAFALALTAITLNASATRWDERADLVSAGAAASVVLHHLCAGAESSKTALEAADTRLRSEAAVMDSSASLAAGTAYWYLNDSTNRKIRALWQANESRGCQNAENLKHLAAGLGFSTP